MEYNYFYQMTIDKLIFQLVANIWQFDTQSAFTVEGQYVTGIWYIYKKPNYLTITEFSTS